MISYLQFHVVNRLGVKTLRNKNEKGFTLIELLVVIAIIGLLASVVLLALNSARQKSRDAKRLADVRQLASGLELYFNDNNSYPTVGFTTAAQLTTANMTAAGLVPKYIGLIPTAPAPADAPCVAGISSGATGGNDYGYQVPAGNLVNSYTMTFCISAITGGYSAGSHTLSPAGIQ